MIQSVNERKAKEEFFDEQKSIQLTHPAIYPQLSIGSSILTSWHPLDSEIILVERKFNEGKHHFDLQEFLQCRAQRENVAQKFRQQTQSNGGEYCLYNWLSSDRIFFSGLLSTHQLHSRLAMLIFNLDFEEAENCIKEMEKKNFCTLFLLKIIQGYKKIFALIETNQEVKRTFLGRKKFQMEIGEEVLKGEMKSGSLLLEKGLTGFEELSVEDKKKVLKQNLDFLIHLGEKVPREKMTDYEILIFTFLTNKEDQLVSNRFSSLLLSLPAIRIEDRLDYAQKLLPLEERKKLILKLHEKLSMLPDLHNVIFYRIKEIEFIKRIITNYLDHYGDLEAVAYLALDYHHPEFSNYIELYLELLRASNEVKKIEKFEFQKYNKAQTLSSSQFLSAKEQNTQTVSFLSQVNIPEEKIQLEEKKIPNRICYICYQPQTKQSKEEEDFFVECGKCKHGGHLIHLKEWFEESDLCPKNDCKCTCN